MSKRTSAWTREPPTKEGWYWTRCEAGDGKYYREVVEVHIWHREYGSHPELDGILVVSCTGMESPRPVASALARDPHEWKREPIEEPR